MSSLKTISLVLVLFVAQAAKAEDLGLSRYTIDGGGGSSIGGSFDLAGTIGQADTGLASGGRYELQGGFWNMLIGTCRHPAPPFLVHASGRDGQTRPFSGYIDPRRESSDGVHAHLGLDSVTLVFSEPVYKPGGGTLDPDDFEVVESGPEPGPEIVSVDARNNPAVELVFSRGITPRAWTTIIAHVENGCADAILSEGNLGSADEPDRLDIAFLPGDIDQSGMVTPIDLLRMRQYIAQELDGGICSACPHHVNGGLAGDYFDTDRDRDVDPVDLLRYRQLLAGTGGATRVWGGATLLEPRP